MLGGCDFDNYASNTSDILKQNCTRDISCDNLLMLTYGNIHDKSQEDLIIELHQQKRVHGLKNQNNYQHSSSHTWQEISTMTNTVDVSDIKMTTNILNYSCSNNNILDELKANELTLENPYLIQVLRNTLKSYQSSPFQVQSDILITAVEKNLPDLIVFKEDLLQSFQPQNDIDEDPSLQFMFNLYQNQNELDLGSYPELILQSQQQQILQQHQSNQKEAIRKQQHNKNINNNSPSKVPQQQIQPQQMNVLAPKENMNLLVIRTAECSGEFILQPYQRQILQERSEFYLLDDLELDESLRKVNKLLKSTKFQKTQNDLKLLKIMVLGSILTFFSGLILGILIHYAFAVAFSFVFFGIVVFTFLKLSSKSFKDDELMVQAQVALALALRAENQKYLRKHIRLRPGHHARWIEVIFL
eukprot:403362426